MCQYCTGIVDEDTADVLESVADAAQNQAEADRDATVTDRLKMAGIWIIYMIIFKSLLCIHKLVVTAHENCLYTCRWRCCWNCWR